MTAGQPAYIKTQNLHDIIARMKNGVTSPENKFCSPLLIEEKCRKDNKIENLHIQVNQFNCMYQYIPLSYLNKIYCKHSYAIYKFHNILFETWLEL